MKKLICAALSLILLMAFSLAATAEATQPEVSPDPAMGADGAIQSDETDPGADAAIPTEDAQAGMDEAFPPDATPGPDRDVDVDGQYTFTCPGALIAMNIEQQDMHNGLLHSASDDTMGVDVYKFEQGEDTLQSIYEAFKADDSLQEVTLADIYGVKALVYRIDETGINVTISGDTGYLYDIMINYQTPEEYQMVGALIASIKKAGAVG